MRREMNVLAISQRHSNRRVVSTAAIALALLVVVTASATPEDVRLDRNPVDRRELEIHGATQPELGDASRKGKASLLASAYEEASSELDRARRAATDVALPARRQCQALSFLGRDA